MTRRTARNVAIAIAAIPLIEAVVATAAYFAAGGFGGGHGSHDLLIGVLGLPATLFPASTGPFVDLPDWLLVIWFPAAFNLMLVLGTDRPCDRPMAREAWAS
jgi:hypothetical protein